MTTFSVKLSNERQHLFFRILVEREDRNIPFYQLPLADKEYLDTHPSLFNRISEHVAIGKIVHHHRLFFHDRFDIGDLVPIFLRTFEFQILGC